MKRLIFIGSSSEGLPQAKALALVITSDTVQPLLWNDVFDPGSLTLETLENEVLSKCCGAVFVATPDDHLEIRGSKVMAPRANVMLEFGLVAGRFGHHATAVCTYGGAELPSDLLGFTVLAMDPPTGESDAVSAAQRKLLRWCSGLLATADSVPRVEVVHGYSGRWDIHLVLNPWRGIPIVPPHFVNVKGMFDLFIGQTGQTGAGFIYGLLEFHVPSGNGEFFAGLYRTSHKITAVYCGIDGSLQLKTEAFSFQKIRSTGMPAKELADLDGPPVGFVVEWSLSPGTAPFSMQGSLSSDRTLGSEGSIQATKWRTLA